MNAWIACIALLTLAQGIYYITGTPERHPRPVRPSRFDPVIASIVYGLAYVLSLLRLPFALLPYGLKVFGVLVIKKHYRVSDYNIAFEAVRVGGEIVNWGTGAVIIEHIVLIVPALRFPLYLSIYAEALRLVAEKGQMIFSVSWQSLPHRHIVRYTQKHVQALPDSVLSHCLRRYCGYYLLEDEQRIQYILSSLHAYANTDPEMLEKLSYLSTLRIVSSSHGLRGGQVRDIARGEVFIHRQWTSDPWLLIGQALRRTPWLFDPRFLRRPFYYRSESNRLSTFFVFTHARYCLPYVLYQFGHEIKSARYDLFYRLLRHLKLDIEPKVQADGTFPFDPGLAWLQNKLFDTPIMKQTVLWRDKEAIIEIRQRLVNGEKLRALDIAIQYTYPVKYVEEVLVAASALSAISPSQGQIYPQT